MWVHVQECCHVTEETLEPLLGGSENGIVENREVFVESSNMVIYRQTFSS